MKMKYIFAFVLSISSLTVFGQSWSFVGSSSGMASGVTEMDMEVSPSGELYVAYIDPALSNKITVQKWSSVMGFQTLGTAGIGAANASSIQLIVTGNKPVVAAKYVFASDTYVEIYRYNGTSWVGVPLGPGGYDIIDGSKGFSIAGSTNSKIYMSFYNIDEQATGYSPENAMLTVNVTDGTVYSLASPNLEMSDVFNVELFMDGTNAYVAHSEADMSNYIPYDISTNGGTYNNLSLDNMDAAYKIRIDRTGSNNVSNAWISDNNSQVYFQAFNGTAFNNRITLATSGASEMDMFTMGSDAYVLYKTTMCYLKKVTNVNTVTPTAAITASGASFIPTSATDLQLESHLSGFVVAYIDGGKIYVKESNINATIEDYDTNFMCEGTSYYTYFGLFALEDNYNKNNLTVTAVSQNSTIIPNSFVSSYQSSISENGVTFSLGISNTNDVSVPTTVDILYSLYDNGVLIGTQYVPVTVNPKPDITFNSMTTEICKNAGPVDLNPKASPAGGTWSGTGVLNNTFHPAIPGTSPVTLTYTKTNNYGCTNLATASVVINQPATLTMSATSSDCEQNTGTASVTISGGISPYTTLWNTGSSLTNISDLSSGQYVVTVVDSKNCTSTGYAMVNSNGVNQTGTVTDVLCNGANTGAINVNLTGGTAPITFAWSNGATTQNLTNLPAGPYELMVTDAQGCISSMTYNVAGPQPLMLDTEVIDSSTCGNADGGVSVTFIGGTVPYSYLWKDINSNPVGTASSLSNMDAGVYTCTVTDAHGCTTSSMHNVSSLATSVFAVDTVINSSCLNDGEIQLNILSGQAQSYQWSNGSTTQNITNLAPGSYSVLIIDTNNCETVIGGTVYAELPEAVEICLVTVDSVTAKNMVVWEKPVSNAIDHFNIYRETSTAGLYQFVSSVDYDDISLYVDSAASPAIRSWRYKLSSVDGCGNESAWSANHKTIHLSTNLGLGNTYNLFWDSYEGFAYSQFLVKRYTTAEGWVTLANMPTNLFTYTDTPPSTAGLFYIVTVDAPSTCSSTLKAQDFNTTRSNRERSNFLMGLDKENSLFDLITMYPNPAQNALTVMNNTINSYPTKVIDQTGRVLREFTLNKGETTIDCTELANGVYYLEFTSESNKTQKRFVVSK